MGRHEIRLRRQKMTSRRIESHKNYYDVLKRHERQSFGRRMLKTMIYLLIFFGLLLMIYMALHRMEKTKAKVHEKEPQAYERFELKTSRPGVRIDVSLNTKSYGKA